MIGLAACMVAQDEPRFWLAIGTEWEVGTENKYSVLFAATALVVALLLTLECWLLGSRRFAEGATLAALLFLPDLL